MLALLQAWAVHAPCKPSCCCGLRFALVSQLRNLPLCRRGCTHRPCCFLAFTMAAVSQPLHPLPCNNKNHGPRPMELETRHAVDNPGASHWVPNCCACRPAGMGGPRPMQPAYAGGAPPGPGMMPYGVPPGAPGPFMGAPPGYGPPPGEWQQRYVCCGSASGPWMHPRGSPARHGCCDGAGCTGGLSAGVCNRICRTHISMGMGRAVMPGLQC